MWELSKFNPATLVFDANSTKVLHLSNKAPPKKASEENIPKTTLI